MLQTVVMFHTTAEITTQHQLEAIDLYEKHFENVTDEKRLHDLQRVISDKKESKKTNVKEIQLFLQKILQSTDLKNLVQKHKHIIRILQQNIHSPVFVSKLQFTLQTIPQDDKISNKEKKVASSK